MADLLNVAQVCKSYGSLPVLKDVSFAVREGEILAIIGPNGAGKTTLFKTMTGESPAQSGAITYRGQDITRLSVAGRVARGMGRTFQVARVFRDFTVLENIVVTVEARRRSAGERVGPFLRIAPSREISAEASVLVDDMGLGSVRNKPASLLSHGDRKRLEFTMTLALRPHLLMLDEPTAGMSPSDRIGIARTIRDVQAARGLTIIMTEHDMDIVFGLADRIMVLNYGAIIAVGSVEEIRGNPAVAEIYLGREMRDA